MICSYDVTDGDFGGDGAGGEGGGEVSGNVGLWMSKVFETFCQS